MIYNTQKAKDWATRILLHVWHSSRYSCYKPVINHECWSHHFQSFTVATMTWLTVAEYLCYKWPRICSVCRNHSPFVIHDL
jgi:hypothetical protein